MDLKKLALLHSGATKVVDSVDLDSNDKELFDDIVKRYSGQKTLKLLKNPANGKSLESTLKDFFKKKKVGVSIKGNEVKFIKDSALKVSDSFEEWSEEEVPEELKSVYSKINEWIENGEGGFEFGEENGAVVYGEFDVDDTHEDDVRSMMEELGYEEVDTDEHHGTYYQFFKKKKVGVSNKGNEVKFIKDSALKVSDSFEEWSEEEVPEELKSVYSKINEWIENGEGGFEFGEENGAVVYGEFDVDDTHEDDVRSMMEELGYEEVDTDEHHGTYYQFFKKKVKDDSGEEQYDRGLKAGEQAREKGWDKEQTLSYYKELQKQFLEGVMKSF